jgi:Ig-like domain-containing protein
MVHWLGLATILALGCDVSVLLPASPALPPAVPGAVDTIVAMTAGAAQTLTAVVTTPSATPTWTPLPTHTATVTPSLTPTFVFRLGTPTSAKTATPTGQSSGDFGCRLISQSPEDGSHFAPKTNFDATWKVKNTGTATWDSGSVDFVYFSGIKMYKNAAYDLQKSVSPGDTISLTAAMIAPKNNGNYTTVWSLQRGNDDFCHVDLKIRVP